MSAALACAFLGLLALYLVLMDGPEEEDPAAALYSLPAVSICLALAGVRQRHRTGLAASAVAASFGSLVSWSVVIVLFAG